MTAACDSERPWKTSRFPGKFRPKQSLGETSEPNMLCFAEMSQCASCADSCAGGIPWRLVGRRGPLPRRTALTRQLPLGSRVLDDFPTLALPIARRKLRGHARLQTVSESALQHLKLVGTQFFGSSRLSRARRRVGRSMLSCRIATTVTGPRSSWIEKT